MGSKGRFSLNVHTTTGDFRLDLKQIYGGEVVSWGNSDSKYPTFIVNTNFTLNAKNEASGWTTIMTTSRVQLNPALSKISHKEVYQLKFEGTIYNSEGNPVYSDYIVILTGTIEEINQSLTGTGFEVVRKEDGTYVFREIEKKNDEVNK